MSDHGVGGSILLPGVGYVELAFVSAGLLDQTSQANVRFLRPCFLPAPGSDPCVLRYSKQVTGTYAVESRSDTTPAIHAVGTLVGRNCARCQSSCRMVLSSQLIRR